MRFSDYLSLAWANLWRRKGRTILTMTGVIIGTAAIVVMLALGLGMEKNMTEQLEAFGNAREITVMPQIKLSGANPFAFNVDESDKLDDDAVYELTKLKGVKGVMPSFGLNTDTEVFLGRYSTKLSISGYDPKYEPEKEKMHEGKNIDSEKGLFIVMGYKVPELFTDSREDKDNKGGDFSSYRMSMNDSGNNAERMNVLRKTATVEITRTVKSGKKEIKKIRTRIIGVIAEKGTTDDYSIYMPMQEVKELYKWVESDTTITAKDYKYESVKVTAETTEDVERLTAEIKDMGYSAFSMKQILSQMDQILAIIKAVLGGIGGVALLVASIGIINTMIMAIYERTKEIGIMKVVGATLKNVRNIFLFEASIIGFFGGLLGVGFSYIVIMIAEVIMSSYVGSMGTSQASGPLLILPAWLAVGAAVFSAFVGLVSGLYPAVKASKLSSLDAIRAE